MNIQRQICQPTLYTIFLFCPKRESCELLLKENIVNQFIRTSYLLALSTFLLTTTSSLFAQTAEGDRAQQVEEILEVIETVRTDVRGFPSDLQDRLIEMVIRPHSAVPTIAFSEADDPSLLFAYYLLDTNEFEPNVFSAAIPGINDQAIQTGANFANGGLPTIGAVRMVFEPKVGLPGNPTSFTDPAAFVDMFTDISGLFVINNEAGWYEGWLIRDLTIPTEIAPLDPLSVNPWGTLTQADFDALPRNEEGANQLGSIL